MGIRGHIYRQSLVKKPTSKNTLSNNTFQIFTLFTYVTHINPGLLEIEQKSIVHINNEINITDNCHSAFVYLLG